MGESVNRAGDRLDCTHQNSKCACFIAPTPLPGSAAVDIFNAYAGAHAIGQVPPIEVAVNALHVQKYGSGGWHAPRATGATATPTVWANGLAKAQMTRVMANIPMPK